jgi:hypothetical protein
VTYGMPKDHDELVKCLKDPQWRIRNLYKVKNKDKQIVPFVPNEAQEELLKEIHYRNLIPKARQRGFSTLIQLLGLDTALFVPNSDVGVIAQDLPTAQEIFASKIKLGYDNLPDVIKAMVTVVSDTTTSLALSNGSKIRVGTSMRGGTPNFIHVSEFGKICAKYPGKAKEVLTGTLPAVPTNGLVFIESTAEGRDGAFYSMTMEAKAAQDAGKKLSALDFKLHFASWWDAPEYEIDPLGCPISEKEHEYFNIIESKIGREVGMRKRAWYITTMKQLFSGDQEMMFQEYPSTLEEAFCVSTKGSYFATQISNARKNGQFKQHIPVLPGIPAYTFWDIGNSDGTAIWVMQRLGMEWRVINFIEDWFQPYSHFTNKLQKLGLTWAKMYVPHDADHIRQGQTSNKSPKDMLEELMPGVCFETVPKIEDINWGIQQTRDIFPLLYFDEEKCKDGIIHLEAYKAKWNTQQACWDREPDKTGGHSEAADALRQFAQAHANGMINVSQMGPLKRKRKGNWRTA